MLIDMNAYVGHWPFRKLRHNTPAKLLRLLDAKGIDQALVSDVSGVFHKNPQPANHELIRGTHKHTDRLVPVAVINPAYADWRHDLESCADAGCRGIRIYPNHHNYRLRDACCRELVHAATERGMLVSIPIRQTDARQRHWLVDVPDVPLADVADLVARHPEARFMLLNGIGYPGSALGRPDGGMPGNYLIGISRLTALMRSEIRTLIDNIGVERLAFGTGICLKYPDPPLVKLEVLDASHAEKDRIRYRNVAAWLK